MVAYHILPLHRKRALEHLSIAFPHEMSTSEKIEVAKKSYQNLGKNAAELVHFHKFKGRVKEIVTVEGLHHLHPFS